MESEFGKLGDEEAGWLAVLAARARVNASEIASHDPDVIAFRKRLPDGKLLPRSKVNLWAIKIARAEGATTLHQEQFMGDLGAGGFRPEVARRDVDLMLELPYGGPFPMKADGTLGQLSAIAHRLAERFGWHVSHTAEWILTGQRPDSLADWGFIRNEGGRRVTIRVPVELPSSYVGKLHRNARIEAVKLNPTLQLKGGPVGSKQLGVMTFCVQRNDGRSWDSMLEEWHEKRCKDNPDWRYKSFRNFARDVRDTYQRVMGRPWQHGGREGSGDGEA